LISRVRLRLYPLGKDQRGEGCFIVLIFSSNTKLGKAVQLKFTLAQHSLDQMLIQKIRDYLGCGTIRKHSQYADVLVVTKLSDLTNLIIPFFDKYKIFGVKYADYQDF